MRRRRVTHSVSSAHLGLAVVPRGARMQRKRRGRCATHVEAAKHPYFAARGTYSLEKCFGQVVNETFVEVGPAHENAVHTDRVDDVVDARVGAGRNDCGTEERIL